MTHTRACSGSLVLGVPSAARSCARCFTRPRPQTLTVYCLISYQRGCERHTRSRTLCTHVHTHTHRSASLAPHTCSFLPLPTRTWAWWWHTGLTRPLGPSHTTAGTLKLQGAPTTGSGTDKFGQYTSTTTKWIEAGATQTIMEVRLGWCTHLRGMLCTPWHPRDAHGCVWLSVCMPCVSICVHCCLACPPFLSIVVQLSVCMSSHPQCPPHTHTQASFRVYPADAGMIVFEQFFPHGVPTAPVSIGDVDPPNNFDGCRVAADSNANVVASSNGCVMHATPSNSVLCLQCHPLALFVSSLDKAAPLVGRCITCALWHFAPLVDKHPTTAAAARRYDAYTVKSGETTEHKGYYCEDGHKYAYHGDINVTECAAQCAKTKCTCYDFHVGGPSPSPSPSGKSGA
jgi:hypothetical protein